MSDDDIAKIKAEAFLEVAECFDKMAASNREIAKFRDGTENINRAVGLESAAHVARRWAQIETKYLEPASPSAAPKDMK